MKNSKGIIRFGICIIFVGILLIVYFNFLLPNIITKEYPSKLSEDYVGWYIDVPYNELSDWFERIDNTSKYSGYAYRYSIVPGIYPTIWEIEFDYDTNQIRDKRIQN